MGTNWNTDLLCLAVAHEMGAYLEERFTKENAKILDSNRRPLLCYYLDSNIVWRLSPIFVETLIDYGADPNEQFQEITPWTWAVKREYDLSDKYTALSNDNELIYRILLEHGANPVHRVYLDSSEDYIFKHSQFPKTLVYTTTFHVVLSLFYRHATDLDRLEIIQLLLRYCIDLDAADSDGTTISAWAKMENERLKENPNSGDAKLGEIVIQDIAAMRERQRVHALWN
ncbi:hypothetical protein BDR22DRAFT_836724 [Usnea florida]